MIGKLGESNRATCSIFISKIGHSDLSPERERQGALPTEVGEHICQYYPVHIVKVVEVPSNGDEGGGDDGCVHHGEQKTPQHAAGSSLARVSTYEKQRSFARSLEAVPTRR